MIIPPIRKQDGYGAGHYLAPRGDRKHQGVDFACYPDSVVLCDVDAVVCRLGHPYAPTGDRGHYRLIELVSNDGDVLIKYMYVQPLVRVGNIIKKGNAIGIVQDLSKIYPISAETPKGIINHYHVEVWIREKGAGEFSSRKHIDPVKYFQSVKA